MNDLALRPALRRFVEAVRLDHLISKDDLESGLAELEADLLRVALDVQVAEARALPLRVACRDDASFPHLNRFHATIRDLLTLELPATLVGWVRNLMAHPEHLSGDELQMALGRATISPARPPVIRALARLLLFESIRAALLLMDHLAQASVTVLPQCADDPQREASGFASVGLDDAAVDVLAEREVTWWLEKAAAFEGEVRPLTVLFAAALVEVQQHVETLKRVLERANQEVAEELERRDELERKLKRMDAPDAILVRNVAAPRFGEQRLTVERLKESHPAALGGRERNALDQRLHQLAARIKEGEWPERKAPALVDLIAEALEKETP